LGWGWVGSGGSGERRERGIKKKKDVDGGLFIVSAKKGKGKRERKE
jgi:hypothetical protein